MAEDQERGELRVDARVELAGWAGSKVAVTLSAQLQGHAPPIVNLIGERVALGPLDRSLLPLIERWHNDFRTVALGGDLPGPRALTTIASNWEASLRGERPDWIGFAIYQWPEGIPIGAANLRDYQNAHGTAEFGITIGEVSARGQGFGTEAVRLLLDYAFSTLGVYNVWLETASYNIGALRAYEKAGFREIGRRRGADLVAGKRYDVVFMDCTADDFERRRQDGKTARRPER